MWGGGGGAAVLDELCVDTAAILQCEVFQTVRGEYEGLEILLLWCLTLELRHFRALPTVPCD